MLPAISLDLEEKSVLMNGFGLALSSIPDALGSATLAAME